MLKNYLLVCVRNILHQRLYSAIKIFGLALGIACCIPIMLSVYYEWSHDHFHKNGDGIYRVINRRTDAEGEVTHSALQPIALAPALVQAHADILHASAYVRSQTHISRGEKKFWQRFGLVDPSFLQIFSFPLVAGDPATALEAKNAVVIDVDVAHKFFAGEDYSQVLGQRLTFDAFDGPAQDYIVTGVMEPVPETSSLRFEMLARIENSVHYSRNNDTSNGIEASASTYVQLVAGRTPSDVEAAMPAVAQAQWGPVIEWAKERGYLRDSDDGFLFEFEPLNQVHFNVDTRSPYEQRADPIHAYVLLGIALLVLFIACINFVTLSVGQSVKRAREVSMRKVLGARRVQLLRQFWGEALLLTLASLLLGIALAELFMRTFNDLAQLQLSLFYFGHWPTLLAFVFLMVLVAFVAGLYPALLVSRFQPVDAFKAQFRIGGRSLFTRTLVVVQYTLSIALMVGVAIMQQQLEYMRDKNLGFAKEEVIVVSPQGSGDKQALAELFKAQVLQSTQVVSAALTDRTFTDGSSSSGFEPAGGEQIYVRVMRIDPDYVQTMGLDLVYGRSVLEADGQSSVLVNKKMVEVMGWEEPVGAIVEGLNVGGTENPTVVGVVQDYHIDSLHRGIEPLVMHVGTPYNRMSIMVRMRPGTAAATMDFLKETWEEFAADRSARFNFLDETLDGQYREEERWMRIVGYAFSFAILLSCLGLLGLASLAVNRQTREIGIRKVLGAGVADVMALLSKDFVRLILVANVLAWALAYYAAQSWLQNFVYRIEIEPVVFVLSGLGALIVALGTLSAQTIKAALANPVDALKVD